MSKEELIAWFEALDPLRLPRTQFKLVPHLRIVNTSAYYADLRERILSYRAGHNDNRLFDHLQALRHYITRREQRLEGL